MWKCPLCGNLNRDDGKFCVWCGSRRPVKSLRFGANDPVPTQNGAVHTVPPEIPPQAKKKNVKRIGVLAAAAAAVIALFLLGVHSWIL